MSLDETQRKFIGYLLGLAREGQEDRGALADLRSGLGKEPGEMARVHGHVVPHLPEKDYNDRWYYVTATLFGSFPKHRTRLSLGAAFRPVAFPPGEPKKDSMEARFIALLNAHPDDLDGHLRHTVSLLKSNEQPLDWYRLFVDLLQWDHPDGHVQLKWARDFYRSSAEQTGSPIDTSDHNITKQEED